MKYDPDIHHRRSIRLREYDYSANGAYFVTICAQGRESLFGTMADVHMHLNDAGRMVEESWWKLPERFPHITLDECVIMPNHFHGIFMIQNVGAGFPRPVFAPENQGGTIPENQVNQGGKTPPLPTLGQIVGYFKYQTTKHINLMRNNPGCPVWQRNYYERIIRNDEELAATREYIVCNPMKWTEDEENQVIATT